MTSTFFNTICFTSVGKKHLSKVLKKQAEALRKNKHNISACARLSQAIQHTQLQPGATMLTMRHVQGTYYMAGPAYIYIHDWSECAQPQLYPA